MNFDREKKLIVNSMNKSIILIVPYFGEWPIWFDAYLKSIDSNKTINWLCPTDCEIPFNHPGNITFLPISLEELNEHINKVVELDVPLSPRKFCDLKPAYGHIFKEHIVGYDFWGVCDVDIIWGDIRKFITNDLLENYDLIASRKEYVSGHFTIIKNTAENALLFKHKNWYQKVFNNPKHFRFDEVGFTDIVKELKEKNKIQVYWKEYFVNNNNGKAHQEYYLDRWLWNKGMLINTHTKTEVMYLHFINWKRTIKKCEVNYNNSKDVFYISYNNFHYNKHSKLVKVINDVKNIFVGFNTMQKKKRMTHQLNYLIKRIVNKVKKV